MWLVGDSCESRGTFYTCPGEPVRPCSCLSLAWFPVMKIWWSTTNSPPMNVNMCFYCISQIIHVTKSGDGTVEMLALQWWEDQVSCQQSIVGQPIGLRLPSEVPSRSEEASNLYEDYPSTCPHNSGPCAFMLNIVSG